jgi:tRNA pseudouridine55 synthase
MDGVLVLDKPAGWTSHDAVNKVRRIAKLKKVGHLGTLDPMATGVLPLVVGKATRLAQFYTKAEKIYQGEVRFGWSTDTYDREGEATSPVAEFTPDRQLLESYLNQFRGTFLQTPPPVSAKKVGGRPAYEFARKQIAVELAPVEVTVHALDLLSLEGSCATLHIHCSAGTYVRGIAHDLGQLFGCGAHLIALRRWQSGPFTLGQAHEMAELERLAAEGNLQQAVIGGSELLPEFPAQEVDDLTAGQIRHGRDFRTSPFTASSEARFVKAIGYNGELIAIGEARLPFLYHPILVL